LRARACRLAIRSSPPRQPRHASLTHDLDGNYQG
jgi:hypothetical protein